MPYVTIPIAAMVVRDESMLGAKPAFTNADKVRAVAGKMETIYGQEQATTTPLTGVCRGAHAWADLTRTAWGAFGTHLRLQVIDQDGVLYNVTPITGRALLNNPFTTSSGSALITVTHDAHGLVADQLVSFPTASSAVNVPVSGAYTVSSVVSSSAYTFLASTVATQSTAGVGGSVDVECGLAPGHVSNLGGLGYGTGGYGSGGYGGPASAQDLDARTWSFANWGQNLIANPNWGAIIRALGWPKTLSRRDAAYAIEGGAWYMRKLRGSWGRQRSVLEKHDLALASYNAGLGSIIKAQAICDNALLWPEVSPCLSQVTGSRNARETTDYVLKIHRWHKAMTP